MHTPTLQEKMDTLSLGISHVISRRVLRISAENYENIL